MKIGCFTPVALALTAGCLNGGADTGEAPADTDAGSETDRSSPVDFPDFRIAAASWGCTGDSTASPDDDLWYYYVKTDGWMAHAELSIVATGNPADDRWAEVGHPMRSLGFAAEGTWEEFGVDVNVVATPEGLVLGHTTRFSCFAEGSDSLTWKIVASSDFGAFADCVTFGHNPEAFIHGIAANSVAGGHIAADASCSNGGPAMDGYAMLD